MPLARTPSIRKKISSFIQVNAVLPLLFKLRFEIFAFVAVKIRVSWHVTPCKCTSVSWSEKPAGCSSKTSKYVCSYYRVPHVTVILILIPTDWSLILVTERHKTQSNTQIVHCYTFENLILL